MVTFLQGLGEVAKAIRPSIDRYNMLEQGYDPQTVEWTLANRAKQEAEQEQLQKEEALARQNEAKRASLAQMIMENGDNLTERDALNIAAQGFPELGKLAANIVVGREERNLEKEKLSMESMGSSDVLPFTGKSMDAQIANLAYQDAINQGMDDFSARKQAADKVRTTRPDFRTNPETGMLEIVPRAPIFGNGTVPSSGGGGNYSDEPLPIDDSMLGVIGDDKTTQEDKTGKELGDAIYDSSGVVPMAQRNIRSLTLPIDEVLGTSISDFVGGEGLEGARVIKQGWLDDTLRGMMSTRSQGELKRLEEVYSVDSLSKEGAIEKTKAIVGVLKDDVLRLQKEIESTVNIPQRNKLISERLTPLQYALEKGEGALQQMQPRIKQENAPRRLKYNPETGRLE